jgi:predicted nucleic acid-binding Zn ribbon protein
MASTLQRLGLWILIIVLALYVIHESYEESPIAELVPIDLMQKALAVGALALIAGIILRIVEKGARVVSKNRCAVCRTVIPSGAIYCRAHLRKILHEEDDRTHMTRLR